MTHTTIFSRDSVDQSIEIAVSEQVSDHGVPSLHVMIAVEAIDGCASYRLDTEEEVDALIRGLQNCRDLIWPE